MCRSIGDEDYGIKLWRRGNHQNCFLMKKLNDRYFSFNFCLFLFFFNFFFIIPYYCFMGEKGV